MERIQILGRALVQRTKEGHVFSRSIQFPSNPPEDWQHIIATIPYQMINLGGDAVRTLKAETGDLIKITVETIKPEHSDESRQMNQRQERDKLKKQIADRDAQIEDLRNKLETLHCDWKEKCIEADTMRHHYETIEKINAILQHDEKRLDWLLAEGVIESKRWDKEYPEYLYTRDAIDTEMYQPKRKE